MKRTVPVGLPVSAATVAVRVTGWWTTACAVEEVSVVVVAFFTVRSKSWTASEPMPLCAVRTSA